MYAIVEIAGQQFKVEKDTVFTPVALDKELAKDALAHVITASYLYKERKYALKEKKKK